MEVLSLALLVSLLQAPPLESYALLQDLASLSEDSPTAGVQCGDTLYTDTVLTGDLNCNTDYGLVIGADSITLDCNGYSITGSGVGYGIYADGRSDVVIKNCTSSNFLVDMYLFQVRNFILEDNALSSPYMSLNLFGQYSSVLNNIFDSKVGVYDSSNTFDSNTFNVDPGYSGDVIQVESPNNTVINNIFTGVNQGVAIALSDEATGCTVANNTISNYQEGIAVYSLGGGARENII